MAQDKVQRPEKEIKLASQEEPIVMTYVVFNDILRFVGNADEALASVMTNQQTRDVILRRLLSDCKKPIQELDELVPVSEIDERGIDFFEIEDLLAWVLEHVTYFFMSKASKIQLRMERFPELTRQMMSSSLLPTGTKA